MDAKAFDLYGPAILQGAVAGNPTIVYANEAQRMSFVDGVVNLLSDVLAKRDKLSQTSATSPT